MKTLKDYINESIQQVNESISKAEIEKIGNAVISVFYNWEDDESKDPRFNAYKEVNKSNWADILEYYQGWEDFYDELGIDEDEWEKLSDKMSEADRDKIHDFIKDEQKHYIDDMYSAVDEWFWDVNKDGYDTNRQKRENYKAMVKLANDPMVDACIDSISDEYPTAEDFREEIEKHLADLCAGELEDL